MEGRGDYIVRATAAGAQIRAFAATTRGVVEEMRQIHNTSPVVSAALGRLLTGGAMIGAMMKGEEDLLTLQVIGDGPVGGMTVTADSHGYVKGYANVPQVILPASAQGKLDVGRAVGSGSLRVIKDMGLKEPYVGQTMLQTGEIAEDLTYYFAISEQVPSSVGLCGGSYSGAAGRKFAEVLFGNRGLGRGEFPGANVGNAFGRTFYADSRYHGDKVSLRMLQTEGGKGGCQHRKERY